jgi:hypothetical protein
LGFTDSRNKKSEEERSPKGLEEGEKGLSRSQKPLREQRKRGGPLLLILESVMTMPTASTNRSTAVCYLSQKPRKSMSAPVFRTSHDPFVLLAIPPFCSYQPQTPNIPHQRENWTDKTGYWHGSALLSQNCAGVIYFAAAQALP